MIYFETVLLKDKRMHIENSKNWFEQKSIQIAQCQTGGGEELFAHRNLGERLL